MQGSDLEDTDRWFGMFRFVGTEILGAPRHLAVRRARRRRVGGMVTLMALAMGAWALQLPGDAPPFRVGFPTLLVVVLMLPQSLRLLRALWSIQPSDPVDLYEGRVPATRSFRDHQTNQLIWSGLAGTERSHRLMVHSATGLLLAVDGEAVAPFPGKVLTTARIGGGVAGGSMAIGDRRSLTQTELAELDAIVSQSTRRPAALAAAYAALVTFVAALVLYLAERLSGHGGWLIPLAFVSTFVCAWFLLRKSAEGLRARVAADRAGGLVRGTTTWRLPVSNLIWELDGLPSSERLARGGLDERARTPTRPQTF